MFRVVTSYTEPGKPPIVEKSPWHSSKEIADYWANMLRRLGYSVKVEDQNHDDANNNNYQNNSNLDNDLADALAQMA